MTENRYANSDDENIVVCDKATWIYPDRIRKLMDFLRMTPATLARKAGTPESTVRKLLQGETTDPRASTFVPILKALDADANIVLGLAPPRDYDKELTREGPQLSDLLRRQVDDLQQRLEEDDRRLVRLREMVLEKGEAKAVAESRVKSLEYMVEKRDETIRQQVETIAQYECRLETKRNLIEQLRGDISGAKAQLDANERTIRNLETMRKRQGSVCRWLVVATCFCVILAVSLTTLFVWEIVHIEDGITGAAYEAYLEELEESTE